MMAARPTPEAFVLCYVSHSRAHFTTQSLETQWGDDWDNAPYEHNAGTPYEWDEDFDGKRGDARWWLYELRWDGPFEGPSHFQHNSPWCVRDINAGRTPWLKGDRYDDQLQHVKIMAGTTLPEFIRCVLECGGKIYLPLTDTLSQELWR